MDSEAVLELGVVLQDRPLSPKGDSLHQHLEILTSSMEGDVRISVTPTESADPEVNECWVGMDQRVETERDEAHFSIDDNCNWLEKPWSQTTYRPENDALQCRVCEEVLSSVVETVVANVQERTVEREATLVKDAHDGDKNCEKLKDIGTQTTEDEENLKDVGTQTEDEGDESEKTVLKLSLGSSKGFLSGVVQDDTGVESEEAVDKNLIDFTFCESRGMENLSGTDQDSEKPAVEVSAVLPDHLLKRMEEGFLPPSDVSIRSMYQSCESLNPVEGERRRVETRHIPDGDNEDLWREMTHALMMVDVTLQRACLQTAFNAVMAFLQEKSPSRGEGVPTEVTTPPTGNATPKPTMPIQSEDLQTVPASGDLSIKDMQVDPRGLPNWSVRPKTQIPENRRPQRQPTVRQHVSPVVPVPNYFRCTESFRRKVTTPTNSTSFGRAGNLPPLRPTPKKEAKSKPRAVSDRCDCALVVEGKSVPKSIRGGGRVVPTRPADVKNVDSNAGRATSSPVVGPVAGHDSRARGVLAAGFATALRRSKRRDSKPPRLNPY